MFIQAGVESRKVKSPDLGLLNIVQINSWFTDSNSFSESSLEVAFFFSLARFQCGVMEWGF